MKPRPAWWSQLIAVALAPAHWEEVVGGHMFHVRGYDASGGVEVHPHEVSHQLGDGGCTNLVGAVRVHALQLHAPLKLVLFAVLGDENKACTQYWGRRGKGSR